MRADPAGRPAALDVAGDALVETPAGTLRIRGRGSRVQISFPRGRTAVSLLVRGPGSAALRRAWLGRVHGACSRAGISLEILLRGHRLARIGAGASQTLTARLLGLPLEAPLHRLALALFGATGRKRSKPAR